MIEPFDRTQLDQATALLRKGFPERSDRYWREGCAAVCPRAQDGHPLGVFLRREGRAVGVLLTFASGRGGNAPPVVNLSSWYVEPEHRVAAPAMLRAVLRAPAVFTDLTPTAPVQALLPRLGFERVSDERGLVALPLVLGQGGVEAELLPFEPGAARALAPEERLLLADHAALGCLALVLHEPGGAMPVVLRRATDRLGLPTAEVVFVPDRSALVRHIAHFARLLLRQGIPTLALEYRAAEPPPLPLVGRRPQARFVRPWGGPVDARGIDHAYSELVYLNRPAERTGAITALRRRLALSFAGSGACNEVLPWALAL